MTRVAISYRRADAAAMAGRMFDRLTTKFGDESVFMDIDKIPYGTNYKDVIQEAIGAVDVLLVVIGPRWLEPGPNGEMPRIMEPDDVLRFEIETAIEQKVPIVPVVVDGGRMPGAAELPASIAQFSLHNAAEVASGRDFRVHMERLIGAIAAMPDRRRKPGKVESSTGNRRQYWLELGAYVVAAGLILVILYFLMALQGTFLSTALHMALSMAACGVVGVLVLRTHQLRAAGTFALGLAISAVGLGLPWFVNYQGEFAGWPFLANPMANSVLGYIAAGATAAASANLAAQAFAASSARGGAAEGKPDRIRHLFMAAGAGFFVSLCLAYVAWQPYCLQFGLADFCLPE